jgi:two-component system alkaline phosphatase synthesis response regulator PhoP
MRSILLVEDDLHLAEGLQLNLEAEGFTVVHVAQGDQVIEEFERGLFDLVLLDIMLPGVDGLSICRQLRGKGYTVPILFITARDQTDQKVEGLLAGGDDYITKPFDTRELLARIQGILRRDAWLAAQRTERDQFEFDGRRINFSTFEASGPGGETRLTRKECMIVKYLVEREGEAVSRDQLLDAVWGYHAFPTNRTVDNFILRIRKVFEEDPRSPEYFRTVHGVGYRFVRE